MSNLERDQGNEGLHRHGGLGVGLSGSVDEQDVPDHNWSEDNDDDDNDHGAKEDYTVNPVV